MTAEAELRARILGAVRKMWPRRLGVLLFGRPASASTGPGHPDLFGIARGRFMALEIKKARAKPTDLQVQRLKDLRACGAYAWIVRTEEQACYAVYWTVKGWTRPLPNEPIDLSDWLLGESAAPAPAQEFAPSAIEPMPFEPGGGRVVDAADEFQIPVPPQKEADLFETEAEPFDLSEDSVPGPIAEHEVETDAGIRVIESDESVHQALLEGLVTMVENMDKDLRTVGDRVTLVFERLDAHTAVLSAVHGMLSKLMQMVADEPDNGQVVGVDVPEQSAPAAPTKRTRRKKVEPPAPEPAPAGPSDLDDIPF